MAKLSIITINFNNKEGLRRTIESVLSQKNVDFEYIVIDGGSIDGSKDIILEYSDRLTRWVSEPDKGIYNAMNKGISLATAEYINFINSGDIINGDYALGFATQIIYKNHSLNVEKYIFVMDCLTVKDHELEIMHGNAIRTKSDSIASFLPHPSTFYYRNSFNSIGSFNEKHSIVSDFEWYMNAIFINKYKIVYYPLCYSVFYMDGISSLNTEKHKQEFKEVINKHCSSMQFKLFTSRKYKFSKKNKLFRTLVSFLRFDPEITVICIKY